MECCDCDLFFFAVKKSGVKDCLKKTKMENGTLINMCFDSVSGFANLCIFVIKSVFHYINFELPYPSITFRPGP